MKHHTTSLLLVTALVLSVFTGACGLVAAHDGTTTPPAEADAENGSDTRLSVGQQLGVAINTQSTDIKGEFEDARFRQRMNYAENRNETAHTRATELQSAVSSLRAERKTLLNEFRAGNISKSEFLARLSTLTHKLDTKSELATRAEAESRTYGVNVEALARLRLNANSLTGNKVSTIARAIAQTGTSPVDVRTDTEGNIRFIDGNDTTVSVDYRVRGTADFEFNLTQNESALLLTVTDGDGTVALKPADMQTNGNLRVTVTKGDRVAEVNVSTKHIPESNRLGAVHKNHADRESDQPTYRHPKHGDKLYNDVPLSLGVGVDGVLVTVLAFEGDTPVANATVTADGEVVGTTDAQGALAFEASTDAQADGEVKITVTTHTTEAETTIQLSPQ